MPYEVKVLSAADPVPPPRRRISVGAADALLGGGVPVRTLSALFGREGSGKSTLSFAMACAAARQTTTLYAVSEAEMTDDDVVRLAHRTSVTFDGLCLATIDTIEDAINAAMDYRAELIVVDSLNAACDWQAPRIKAAIGRLQRWCRDHDRAGIVLGMYDTAGRRAGGMAVAYRPDALIDLLAPDDRPRFGEALALLLDTLDEEQREDLLGTEHTLDNLRLMRVHKSRFSPRGIVPLRMTAAGITHLQYSSDSELRQMLEVEVALERGGDGSPRSASDGTDAA
jgi:predicted ATP-dependent serine protease